MARSDGTRIKGMPAFERAIPYIMNKRCDSTNFAKVEFDMTNLHAFLGDLRQKGHKIGVMDAIIAAYLLLVQKVPQINRFVVNKKMYQRNHVCISFTMLKQKTGGGAGETAVKVYLEPGDDLLVVSQKTRQVIRENEKPETRSIMDVFVDKLMGLPLIPNLSVGILKQMDKRGILPKKIIKLSPFHTSMFVSNLASIQMNYVYHHLYEFGTNGLFVAIGMPKRIPAAVPEEKTRRMMTLGVSLDDRVCTGAVWASALFEFKRILEQPARFLLPALPEESAGKQKELSLQI